MKLVLIEIATPPAVACPTSLAFTYKIRLTNQRNPAQSQPTTPTLAYVTSPNGVAQAFSLMAKLFNFAWALGSTPKGLDDGAG